MIMNAWPAEELFTALVINALEGDILTVVAEYHGVGDPHDRRGGANCTKHAARNLAFENAVNLKHDGWTDAE